MIQTTLNGKNVLIVDVPEEPTNIEVNYNGFEFFLSWVERDEFGNHPEVDISEYFPPGAWSMVGPGLCSEVTEEEARNIVEWYGKGDGSVDEAGVGDTFMCYDDSDFCFDTGVESLHSFIRSNGKEPTKVVLLINQNETPQTTTK